MQQKHLTGWFIALVAVSLVPLSAFGEGESNPTGVAGVFNGNITTGCSYDPFTGNIMRVVDDMVVPGSVGAYPLKWTRYYNSRNGGEWAFSYYSYTMATNGSFGFPDGREITADSIGVPEVGGSWRDELNIVHNAILMADGGKVIFDSFPHRFPITDPLLGTQWVTEDVYIVSRLIDPYGQATIISNEVYGHDVYNNEERRITNVREPGGRYLQINYSGPYGLIASIEAHDASNNLIQSVSYTYTDLAPDHPQPATTPLTGVAYSDGTSATYTYQLIPGAPPPNPTPPSVFLLTANDVRYHGPMRQIKYDGTTSLCEKNLITGEAVSTRGGGGGASPPLVQKGEIRGDGATRTFTYDNNLKGRTTGVPGKLVSFTDFLGNSTSIEYEQDWNQPSAQFITAVTDPNGRKTVYTRSTQSWGITKITHLDTSGTEINHISQTYTDEANPYYLTSRTDELGHITNYTRDANNRITRIDYADASYETFTYNTLGEVLGHRMTSGGTEVFTYDTAGTGLKTSYTDATGNTTTYSYYPAGHPWADRLQTETHSANASSLQASETYEYDLTCALNQPCSTRGWVTKITHADNTYQSFTYNVYGDKLTETDELGHTTTHTYDDYGRVTSTTTPKMFPGDTLNHTTTNSYVPTGKTSSEITTSALPFSTTLPSGKTTNTFYDGNWRKTRVQVAPNTTDEANSYFHYDEGTGNIGRLTSAIDPRNNTTTYGYDNLGRQTSITDALGHTTSATFDLHGNKKSETHANGELITFDFYDVMNRLTQKTVHRDNNTSPTLDVTSMTYDTAGNLSSNMDENGNVYRYLYDLMNRPTQLTYPNALTEQHVYDAAGNVATYKNRTLTTQTFSYDNRNRQTGFTWNDQTTSPQTTAYDAASRKTQIINNDATINFTYYDDSKLHTQEEWSIALSDNVHRTVTYTYDADGNRSSIQYPSGSSFNYGYTNRNQVASIADNTQHHIVDYTFDASGNITGRTLDNNNTSSAYTVDSVNRDTSIQISLAGGVTKRFDYAYNAVNDITAVKRDSDKGDIFQYDLTQQITRYAQNGNVDFSSGTITSPSADNNLTFDGCGNKKTQNGTTFLPPNTMNQPTDPGITYDTNGNLLTSNGYIYRYDAQNRLRTVLNASNVTIAQFYYDGLNRQVARSIQTPGPTASPTPTPPPNQVAPVTFSTTGSYPNPMLVSMSTSTVGAIIFYTTDSTTPTHTGATATGSTQIYTVPVSVTKGQTMFFEALAYKAGMTDSNVTSFYADNRPSGGPQAPSSGANVSLPTASTITFSVWDGDWAILEEYGPNNVRTEAYVQGLHGLVKTLMANVYYYQDELGSTSHIADSAGTLLESYRYDLYGKPTYWTPANSQLPSSSYGTKDLFTGQRFVPELGLYDNRNRFMSPDLGRFLQPDPIGFKGDGSNLYRYCGNDWANKTDPMGLDGSIPADQNKAAISEDTNGPSWGLDQGFADDRTKAFEQQMNATNANTPGAQNVEWHAKLTQVHDPNFQFKPGQIAVTDWKVTSTPKMDNGKVAGFRNDLQITVHLNDSASLAKYRPAAQDKITGELAHMSDALHAGNHESGGFSSAWKIANNIAREQKGGSSADYAKSKMESGLREWSNKSMEASHNEWDTKVYAPSRDAYGHIYGLFEGD